MKNRGRYVRQLLAGIAVIVGFHLLLVKKFFPELSFPLFLKLDLVNAFIFLIGLPIVTIGNTMDDSGFVGRFLVLTTVQMLSFMALLAALFYVQTPDFRPVVLHLVALFVALLAMQSTVMIRSLLKKAD